MIDNYCCCSLLRDCCPSPLPIMQNYKVTWSTYAVSWKVPRVRRPTETPWMDGESWVNIASYQIYFSKRQCLVYIHLSSVTSQMSFAWFKPYSYHLFYCIAEHLQLFPLSLPGAPTLTSHCPSIWAAVVFVFLQLGLTFPRREGSSPQGQLLHSIT